jgi:hypothetical protein
MEFIILRKVLRISANNLNVDMEMSRKTPFRNVKIDTILVHAIFRDFILFRYLYFFILENLEKSVSLGYYGILVT